MSRYRLAVVGSRSFNDKGRLYRILDPNIDKIDLIIISDTAGASALAHEWCKERGKPVLIVYPQLYTMDGEFIKGAIYKRDNQLIKLCDKILCFWDGQSSGTGHIIEAAEFFNKPIRVFRFENKLESATNAHRQ